MRHKTVTAPATLFLALSAALGVAQPPPLPFYQQVDWSPDGRHLAYCAVVESWETGYEIFVLEADGSAPRLLGPGMYPVFSPDGERLAFARDGDLFTMRVDGSDLVRLTEGPERDSYPAWAPDGTFLVYMSNDGDDYDIYRIAADGAGRHALTDHPAHDYNAAISPDGTWLVFERHPEGEATTLHLMRADGSDERSLGISGSFPHWSPDGEWIAFGGADGVFVVRPDGTERRAITEGAFFAAWSPDGSRLVLATEDTDAEGRRVNGIASIRADGTDRRQLVGGVEP